MQEDNWTDETRERVGAHFNRLKEFTEKGKVVLAGRSNIDINDEDNFGIVVFEAESELEAKNFMDKDPTIEAGIMTAALFPFSLALLRESNSN